MNVRNVSGGTGRGLRTESARRPLYPTRPDPTRPFYTGETSHHVVTYVTRVSAAGVVAGPVDEMMTGLSIIEGIDLDAEIPCEVTCKLGHPLDPHPADVLSRFVCHQCGHVRVKARCWPIVRATESGLIRVYCTACGDFPAEPDLTTIEVLR